MESLGNGDAIGAASPSTTEDGAGLLFTHANRLLVQVPTEGEATTSIELPRSRPLPIGLEPDDVRRRRGASCACSRPGGSAPSGAPAASSTRLFGVLHIVCRDYVAGADAGDTDAVVDDDSATQTILDELLEIETTSYSILCCFQADRLKM